MGPERQAVLALAIASGDREAENEFVGYFLPRVRLVLMARSRDRQNLDDLAQEAMIAAICALRRGQLRDPEKLSAFVAAVARNVLSSHYRAAQRDAIPLEDPELLPDLRQGSLKQEEEDRLAQAAEAISKLEDIDRQILQLTLVDGLKPGMIAKQLQISSEVVRQRKSRATRRIAAKVQILSQNSSGGHHINGGVR